MRMKKTIAFLFLCLLFSGSALAKMSDEEARAFLESLAKPSTERRVFYRWQSETVTNNLLQAGEMTPQLYEHFMNTVDETAGSGFYVAEDIASSSSFGTNLIQVELEPGYKYLNLQDPEVQEKLKSEGLDNGDVFRLNPKVAVNYVNAEKRSWLVLKAQEGIKFKTFSLKACSTKNLAELYSRVTTTDVMRNSIKKEVLKRAEKDLSSVVASSLISDLEKRYGKSAIQSAVRSRIQFMENFKEIKDMLFYARKYLTPKDKEQIGKKSLSLIRTIKEGFSLLNTHHFTLSPESREQILKKSISLIKTAREGVNFLSKWGFQLSSESQNQIVKKVIPHVKTAEEGLSLLYRLRGQPLLSEERMKLAVKILELDENQDLSQFLTDEEFKTASTQFENKKLRRLNCLKKQLSKL